jgi:hypothetical protein
MTARTRLTRGALEVALLAAAGRSNKQIAADMCLSVRTVENRLQRVYEELRIRPPPSGRGVRRAPHHRSRRLGRPSRLRSSVCSHGRCGARSRGRRPDDTRPRGGGRGRLSRLVLPRHAGLPFGPGLRGRAHCGCGRQVDLVRSPRLWRIITGAVRTFARRRRCSAYRRPARSGTVRHARPLRGWPVRVGHRSDRRRARDAHRGGLGRRPVPGDSRGARRALGDRHQGGSAAPRQSHRGGHDLCLWLRAHPCGCTAGG